MGSHDETRSSFQQSQLRKAKGGLYGLTEGLGLEPASHDHDPLAGKNIGGITLLRLVAEGGMGRVYEGKQEKPNRTVAVKVMRPGITSPKNLKRFEYEVEVLARLQHPGIAHIYSAGVHRMGNTTVPYFVMEYIADAKSLTKYAADLKLPTKQRLNLFRAVCEAVAHGHKNGVVHRDLKPSNILVDATGMPKVIDFGIARVTNSGMPVTSLLTDVGQLIGTLQYMSPEQFEVNPNGIDIRTDVYALGVILYELLAGRPPYDVKQKAIHEVARIVQENEPPLLSSINRTVPRDVVIIAGKCLAKDKNSRYASASVLSLDVSRYLNGEPIIAMPPRLLSTLHHLVKRRKATAVAFLGIAVSILVATILSSLFAIRVRNARSRFEDQRYRTMIASTNDALREENFARASTLFRDTKSAFAAAYGESTSIPLELSLFQPLLDQSFVTLSANDGPVSHVVVSPDGSRIATASECVHIWDFHSGRNLHALRVGRGGLLDLAYSPMGDQLACATCDGAIYVWDANTGVQTATFYVAARPFGKIAFSPDGIHLAATDQHGIRIWNTSTGLESRLLRQPSSVLCFCFSPDGTKLLTGGSDRTARLWNARDGEELAAMSAENGSLTNMLRCVAFSPDGSHAAIGSNTVNIWDLQSGEEVSRLPLNRRIKRMFGEQLVSLVFSSDGGKLAIVRTSGVTIWDSQANRFLPDFAEHDGPIYAGIFTQDGRRFVTASADHTCGVWNSEDGTLIKRLVGHSDAVLCLTLTADGHAAVTGSQDGTSRIWSTADTHSATLMDSKRISADIGSNDLLTSNGPGGLSARFYSVLSPSSAGFSPDGTRVAALSGGVTETIAIWDARCLKFLGHTGVDRHSATAFAFSPDASKLASGWENGGVRIHDMVTGGSRVVIPSQGKPVASIAYSPDGKRIASTTVTGRVLLWDPDSDNALVAHQTRPHVLGSACAFDPRKSQFVAASPDNCLQYFDSKTGNYICSKHLEGISSESHIWALRFCPDGSRLVAQFDYGLAALFDADTLARLGDFDTAAAHPILVNSSGRTHQANTVMDIVFSGNSKLIATMSGSVKLSGMNFSRSTAVRVWDAETGAAKTTIKDFVEPLSAIAINADGSRIVTADLSEVITIWDTDSGEPIVSIKTGINPIRELSFSPNGRQLLVVGDTMKLLGITNAEIASNRIAAGRTCLNLSVRQNVKTCIARTPAMETPVRQDVDALVLDAAEESHWDSPREQRGADLLLDLRGSGNGPAPRGRESVKSKVTSYRATIEENSRMTLVFQIALPSQIGTGTSQEDKAETQTIPMKRLLKIIEQRVNPSGSKKVIVRRRGQDQIEVIAPRAGPTEMDVIKRIVLSGGEWELRIVASRKDPRHEHLIKLGEQARGDIVLDGTTPVARWVRWGSVKKKLDVGLVSREAADGCLKVLVVLDKWNVNGRYVVRAREGSGQQGEPNISVTLNPTGANLLSRLTRRNLPDPDNGITSRLGIVFDNTLISAPQIRSVVSNDFIISDGFERTDVAVLVRVLNSGSLPAALKSVRIDNEKIDP